ncbi:hypothetical protein BH23CHL7_BH23CHL7_11410 [soil metagenome]
MSRTEPIADFFNRECCATSCRSAPRQPRGTAEMLLRALSDEELEGRSVLEIGSGDGSLSRALISRGASTVSGLDLSPVSVEAARSGAAEAGREGRLSYQVADAAQAPLAEFDVVLSEKVFCCYPQPEQLMANTLPAAGSLYAIVLPESRGLIGLVAKLVVAAENGLRRLGGDPFRAYVHDLGVVQSILERAGFHLRSSERHWGWLALVFTRNS